MTFRLIRESVDGLENGRSGVIRTRGPYVPNVVLYQAELHSDADGRAAI